MLSTRVTRSLTDSREGGRSGGEMATHFMALDGEWVEIDTTLQLGPESCNAGVELRGLGIKYQHLISGPLAFARHYALSPRLSEGMRLTEEFSFQDGTLLLGAGNQIVGDDGARYGHVQPDGTIRPGRVHMAVWEGETHSLLTFRYTADDSFNLLSILGHFQITEVPTGVKATPRDTATTFYVSGPKTAVDVPQLGLLDIRKLTPELAKGLPKDNGTRVRGGELFAAKRGDDLLYFVLVGESTVTYVLPYEVSEGDLMGGLEELVVSGS